MNVYIATGINEFDIQLSMHIQNSKIIFYQEFFENSDEFDTAIISPKFAKENFTDFLYSLRSRDKRIILLIDDQDTKNLAVALCLGIYDLVFYPATVEKVIHKLNNPARFSDVKMYIKQLKIFENVGFVVKPDISKEQELENSAGMQQPAAQYIITPKSSDFVKSEDELKRILQGILFFLGRKKLPDDLFGLCLMLEDEIVELLK